MREPIGGSDLVLSEQRVPAVERGQIARACFRCDLPQDIDHASHEKSPERYLFYFRQLRSFSV